MQLTPLQLQIQERSDKTLSTGCIIQRFEGIFEKLLCFDVYDRAVKYHTIRLDSSKHFEESTTRENFEKIRIIGHPMNWGRLWYLLRMAQKPNELPDTSHRAFSKIERFAMTHSEVYQQTVLERPVELQELVLKFLSSLPKDEKNM